MRLRYVIRRLDTMEFEPTQFHGPKCAWASKLANAYTWYRLETAKNQQQAFKDMGIETEIIDLKELEILW